MLSRGLDAIDVNSRMSLMFEAISRWLGFTLDTTALSLSVTTAIFCVCLVHYTNFSSAGD